MLTVHAGLHKTGSTSIQTTMDTLRGNVGRRQAYLPWTSLFRTDGVIDPAGIARIRRLSSRGWHVVVSSEGALGPMTAHALYPDAARIASELDAAFSDLGLRLVVYLRPQSEWAASAYSEHVRAGGCQPARDYTTDLLDQPYLRHAALIDDLRRHLRAGALVVRPYRPEVDVVRDFFTVCGLGPVPALVGTQRANVTPSAQVIDAIRRANEADVTGTPAADVAGERCGMTTRSILPEDCRAELRELFLSDWPALARIVAELPGHDPTEFTALVDAACAMTSPTTVGASVPEATATTSPGEPGGEALRRAQRSLDLVQRGTFMLRHGPRRAVLATLTRAT